MSRLVERLTAVPVPVSVIVCTPGTALSVIVIEPLRAPFTVGVKVTDITHEAAGARAEPHVLVWAKSPTGTMLAIFSAAVPVFVSVTDCALLVVPTT